MWPAKWLNHVVKWHVTNSDHSMKYTPKELHLEILSSLSEGIQMTGGLQLLWWHARMLIINHSLTSYQSDGVFWGGVRSLVFKGLCVSIYGPEKTRGWFFFWSKISGTNGALQTYQEIKMFICWLTAKSLCLGRPWSTVMYKLPMYA